jgi:hypothetical protein
MTDKKLVSFLLENNIPEKFWPEMRALVFSGVRPSYTLRKRLRGVINYKKCLHSILVELSKKCKHKFPPANYRCPAKRRNAA